MFALFYKQAIAALHLVRLHLRIASFASPLEREGFGRIALIQLTIAVLSFALFTPAFAAGKPITIVALGDSLTAGYRLGPDDGFVPQLQRALKAKGYDNVTIADAGVSGDTSAGGLSRLDWAVGPDADGVILELGANDALRGIDPKLTLGNLQAIITRLEARHLPILLAGMLAPPNMGADYGKRFNVIYRALAAHHRVVFYPFFLDGVAVQPKLTLDDGMHPNAEGVGVIVARILPSVEDLIGKIETAKAAAK